MLQQSIKQAKDKLSLLLAMHLTHLAEGRNSLLSRHMDKFLSIEAHQSSDSIVYKIALPF